MSPRIAIPIIIVIALIAGFFVYPAAWGAFADRTGMPDFPTVPFKLGLDLQGGTHLVYQADVSQIAENERSVAMDSLRDVIERRVDLFGVAEPSVAVNRVGDDWRLVVELAGVTEVSEAIALIGETPFLEFRELREDTDEEPAGFPFETDTREDTEETTAPPSADDRFVATELTGRFLQRAQLSFNPQTSEPEISIEFNREGAELFAELTRRHVGNPIAIYLDGELLSAPIVQQEIRGGQAQITGNFTIEEARQLVQNLNAGALPVPIALISQQTIGATLGQDSLQKSLVAGVVGLLLVILFMTVWYRMAGVLAALVLIIYVALALSVFKLIPITLTLAGIVGFILSIGLVVDANILVFERMKEELRKGRPFHAAVEEGFSRAWTAIRDSYTSTIMTAAILYWFGTSLIRGFALTLVIGLLISLATAFLITRVFLRAFGNTRMGQIKPLWRQ